MTNIQNDENKVSTQLNTWKRRVENVQNHPEMELLNKYLYRKKRNLSLLVWLMTTNWQTLKWCFGISMDLIWSRVWNCKSQITLYFVHLLKWSSFHTATVLLAALAVLTRSNECQNFPGNKIPGQKISRRNVPGQENSGTRKFQEFHFFPEFEKYFFEKIPGFFPAWAENSRTSNPT